MQSSKRSCKHRFASTSRSAMSAMRKSLWASAPNASSTSRSAALAATPALVRSRLSASPATYPYGAAACSSAVSAGLTTSRSLPFPAIRCPAMFPPANAIGKRTSSIRPSKSRPAARLWPLLSLASLMERLNHLLEDSALKNSSRVLPVCGALVSMLLFCLLAAPLRAQSESSLSQRIQKVISRPEFTHANFGIEFYSLDAGKVVYALNAAKMFVPASTTKILTEGTLLAKLGADYRFHTRVYRTGPVDSKGKLKGDLILVASGDPNLSNRIQPDGTLAFVDHDHSYQGPA